MGRRDCRAWWPARSSIRAKTSRSTREGNGVAGKNARFPKSLSTGKFHSAAPLFGQVGSLTQMTHDSKVVLQGHHPKNPLIWV